MKKLILGLLCVPFLPIIGLVFVCYMLGDVFFSELDYFLYHRKASNDSKN